MNKTQFSKYLSSVLRHKPEYIDIILDKEGYVECTKLIASINKYSSYHITLDTLKDIVINDEKQRYSFKDNYKYIRANQGHSTKQVDLTFKNYVSDQPLFHGTASRFVRDITNSGGLKPMSRHYVHLSKDIETATKVGIRHGDVVILQINTKAMLDDGYALYESDNGVVLTTEVPMKYISFV